MSDWEKKVALFLHSRPRYQDLEVVAHPFYEDLYKKLQFAAVQMLFYPRSFLVLRMRSAIRAASFVPSLSRPFALGWARACGKHVVRIKVYISPYRPWLGILLPVGVDRKWRVLQSPENSFVDLFGYELHLRLFPSSKSQNTLHTSQC